HSVTKRDVSINGARKDHARPYQIGSHDANVAIGRIEAVAELLREDDQGNSLALSIEVKAAATVHGQQRIAGGEEARAAAGQNNAAPKVEIFRVEDRDNFGRRIGHHNLGWTVVADVGVRKLVDVPDPRLRSGQGVVRPVWDRHAGQLPIVSLSQ